MNEPAKAPPKGRSALRIVLGGCGVALLLCCLSGLWVAKVPPSASAAAWRPFDVSAVPVPAFPALGPGVVREDGVTCREVRVGSGGGYGARPGHDAELWVYMPPGEHAPGSLPCVLIAPAGTSGFEGMVLADGDRPEHLPWAAAGFVVVAYSLDGPDDGDDPVRPKEAFRRACAGVVNGRNALELALAVPEVDPQRVFAVGHSSAGRVALLLAAHERRLAGCVAFAPGLGARTPDSPALARLDELLFPGITDLAVQSDPATHAARFSAPVLLFHADDDTVTLPANTRALADALRAAKVDVTLETTPSGGHYRPMIDPGIPRAIAWALTQER